MRVSPREIPERAHLWHALTLRNRPEPMTTPARMLRLAAPKTLARLGGADAALALFVVTVVGLMVIPLPTWLLDILLATNLSGSVAILLVVLYVPDALGIATFPTLLLITTLYRLALNVSSTRLILLQANAGEVIRSFGQFVVRGNYVVGAVVFLILTIIQFVVIAKGSERVAEVGARFVLDAMPGKQMAIDAEARSGAIDGNEARRRRRQLARESQFYGAMDGAMKFVKGDVIASVIITVVNILGGLAIGVGQRGLEVQVALKRYGLLTIGDGLVTQIPALVLSTAAGILVTRVASEDPDHSLGTELASQIFGTPKALRVAGAFVFGLAIVPGLPAMPFLVMAFILFVSARSSSERLRVAARKAANLPAETSHEPGKWSHSFVPMVVPWSIDVKIGRAHV
jgi:type III secretion protein V